VSLKSVKNTLDRSLEILTSVTVAVLVIDVLWQVFTRLVLNDPSSWTEELAIFLLIWVSLLGAAVALNRGAHLGIDYFVSKLPERARLYTEVLVFACISLFSICVMVAGGFSLVISTLELGQESPALGVKVGYVYLAIPISGLFLALYAIIAMLERLARLFGRRGESVG
jgi:TRAP-type C4-dicarboxylate transport system permease small subunit